MALRGPVSPDALSLHGRLLSHAMDPKSGKIWLEAGEYTLFWVTAKSRARITVDAPTSTVPQVLRVGGDEPLRGGLILVEEDPQVLERGRWMVLNPDVRPVAMLVGGRETAGWIAVDEVTDRIPLLAWEAGERRAWNQLQQGRSVPLELFNGDENDELRLELAWIDAVYAELKAKDPELELAYLAWRNLSALGAMMMSRPAVGSAWSRRDIFPRAWLGYPRWIWTSPEGEREVYIRVPASTSLDLELEGPGVLDVQLRSIVDASQITAESSSEAQDATWTASRDALRLHEISIHPRMELVSVDQRQHGELPRTMVPVDAKHWLGRREHFRLPTAPGRHRYTFRQSGRELLVRLRHDRLRPRIAAWWAGAEMMQQRHRALESLAQVDGRDAQKKRMQILMEGWRDANEAPISSPSISSLANVGICPDGAPWLCARVALELARRSDVALLFRIAQLQQACQHIQESTTQRGGEVTLRQDVLAQLAEELIGLSAAGAAATCLGDERPVRSGRYVRVAAKLSDHQSEAQRSRALELAHRWVLQAPENASARAAFFSAWRESSAWRALHPVREAEANAFRWLLDEPESYSLPWHTQEDRELAEDDLEVGDWQRILTGRPYELDVPSDPWHRGRWSVLNVALRKMTPGPRRGTTLQASSILRISLDGEESVFPVSREGRRAAWLISPGRKKLQVSAPTGSVVYVDVPVRGPDGRFLEKHPTQKMWPIESEGRPTLFHLPEMDPELPLRIDFRYLEAGQASQRQKIPITIRDDLGNQRRVWLHIDPRVEESVTPLEGAARVGARLSTVIAAFPYAKTLRIEAPGYEKKLAVSLRFRGSQLDAHSDSAHNERLKSARAAQQHRRERQQTPSPVAQHETTRRIDEMGMWSARLDAPGNVVEARLQRARLLVELEKWSELRDELEWLLLAPTESLKPYRREIEAILDELYGQGASRYYVVHSELMDLDGRGTLRWPALDVLPTATRPRWHELQQSLRMAAMNMDTRNPHRISEAMLTLSTYQQQLLMRKIESKELLTGLAYGMMESIEPVVDGAATSSATLEFARRSRWEQIAHASESAGYEDLIVPVESDVQAQAFAHALLVPPWGHVPGTVFFDEGAGTQLRVERNRDVEIRGRFFCRRKEPPQNDTQAAIHASQLVLTVDRFFEREIDVHDGQEIEQFWSLAPGSHAIGVSMVAPSPWRCSAIFDERSSGGSQGWKVLQSSSRQRWWTATPKRPVRIELWGPGAARFDIRKIGSSNGTVQFYVRSPSGRLEQIAGTPSPDLDPNTRVERDSTLSVGAVESVSVLLPEDGLYQFEIRPERGESLVSGRIRVPTQLDPSSRHLSGLALQWRNEWSQRSTPPSLWTEHRFPAAQDELMRTSSARLERLGAFSIASQFGIEQESDVEIVRGRVVSAIRGDWQKSWVRDRLWSQSTVRVSSEDFISPAQYLSSELTHRGERIGLRTRVGGFGASQWLDGWGIAWGAWLRFDWPIERPFKNGAPWVLTPTLRLDAKGFSSGARRVAAGPYGYAMHSSVYRLYNDEHPWMLKPGLRFDWRQFGQFRASLGQDNWINSSFRSLDRVRGWLRLAGLAERYRGWTKGWWTYALEYQMTYALADEHRLRAFHRHVLTGELEWTLNARPRHRWTIGITNGLVFQDGYFAGDRFFLNLGFVFDPGRGMEHFAPQHRLYRNEIGERWWFDPQDPWSE